MPFSLPRTFDKAEVARLYAASHTVAIIGSSPPTSIGHFILAVHVRTVIQRLSLALRSLLLAVCGLAAAPAADAADCPGNPDALGTTRVIEVDASTTPQVGRKHFPVTLPLAPREVVLTFDYGPLPGTTARVLDALRRECARATFFLLGRNVAAHPALARRELA
jgi:hypothetical protein